MMDLDRLCPTCAEIAIFVDEICKAQPTGFPARVMRDIAVKKKQLARAAAFSVAAEKRREKQAAREKQERDSEREAERRREEAREAATARDDFVLRDDDDDPGSDSEKGEPNLSDVGSRASDSDGEGEDQFSSFAVGR